MFCKKCGHKANTGDKFCEECGELIPHVKADASADVTIEKPVSHPEIKIEAPKVFKNRVLEHIADHLEFLGYQIEKELPQSQGKQEVLLATSVKNHNIVGFAVESGIVIVRSTFSIEKAVSAQMDAAVNLLSSKLDVCNVYYEVNDGKVSLRFESVFTGEYSKELFGKFLNYFSKDIDKMYLIESVNNAFVN